jgi:pimeloyl-ACP methyl ester carboxylesterase
MTDTLRVRAGEITFTALAWGPRDGPLALCLHGYPDTARSWRHLGPHLAERGWRVVAPYMRGYGPTDLAPDGAYQLGALARDAVRLHEVLGGDERAALIGHDWGAAATYAVGAHYPGVFGRIVTLAVMPTAVTAACARDPRLVVRQLRRSWYMFWNLLPGISERALPRLVPHQWAAWSPGYDAREDVEHVLSSLRDHGRATAALRYYRALFLPWMLQPAYAAEQSDAHSVPRRPLLYVYGEDDGCLLPEVSARTLEFLAPGSRVEAVAGAGHFLHLERPREVNALVAEWLEA